MAAIVYELALIPVVVAVIFLVPFLLNRGKWLKCPDCGEVFKAPAMDQRSMGVGFSPPGLGKVKCPKCGQMRARRDYLKVPPPTEDGSR